MAKAYLVRAYGRVQGVGYRASVCRAAKQEGVAGWVRNLTDGSVEALLSGEEGAVEKVLSFMRGGPAGAVVKRLEVEETEVSQLSDFSIDRTENASRV